MDEAIDGYMAVIPLVPEKIQLSLRGNLGALLMAKGRYTEAKENFLAAVDVDPSHASSQFNLAVLLTSKLNEHAKALKHCALAIRADPTAHKAYHLMGNIMQSLGKPKEAEKYFEKAELLASGQDGGPTEATSSDNPTANPTPSLADLLRFLPMKAGEVREHVIDGRSYAVQCMSQQPLILMVDALVPQSDCKQVQLAAEGLLEKSFVMGSGVVEAYDSQVAMDGEAAAVERSGEMEDPKLYRSSYTAWLPGSSLLERWQGTLAQLLHIPLAYLQHKSEDLQVVRYRAGGQFKAHQDSSAFHQRLFTALIYLNDVEEEGGETWFPFAEPLAAEAPASVEEAVLRALESFDSLPVHALSGLLVKPKAGRAVIFFNFNLSTGHIDPQAVHAGMPVRGNGEKWIANYWVENDPALLADLLNKP